MYSSSIIISERFTYLPPPRFGVKDAAFPLINRCRYIRDYIAVSPPILRIMGDRKSTRTTSTLLVYPTMFSCALGGIDGVFVL